MSFADELQQRLFDFALDVLRFCRTLPRTAEAREIEGQLRRASTAASANYRASRRGRSRREWIAKIGVVVEELDESDHWFAVICTSHIAEPPEILIKECRALRAILAKSRTTARKTRSEHAGQMRRRRDAP